VKKCNELVFMHTYLLSLFFGFTDEVFNYAGNAQISIVDEPIQPYQ